MAHMSALRPLYPHQERALEALRASVKAGKRRPMLQAPSGFGKTLMAATSSASPRQGQARRLRRCPSSVIDQTIAAFGAEGIKRRRHAGQHPRPTGEQPVQVCRAQTLARRTRRACDSSSSTRRIDSTHSV